MTFPTEFDTNEKRQPKWVAKVLVLSLALNIFGAFWYVTSGVMDSNLPIAQSIKELKGQGESDDFSEIQLIERITSKLSKPGAELVFKEYAIRKPGLDRLIAKIKTAQEEIKAELANETINETVLSAKMKDVAHMMAQRLDIMTDLVLRVLPDLSLDDRKKIGALK